jgi:predicted NAD-dependent protein-ADP-ribosyltransferase YbiA (DUF1768 family)
MCVYMYFFIIFSLSLRQVSTGNKVTCGIRASDSHIECWGVGRHIGDTEHLQHEWEQVSVLLLEESLVFKFIHSFC